MLLYSSNVFASGFDRKCSSKKFSWFSWSLINGAIKRLLCSGSFSGWWFWFSGCHAVWWDDEIFRGIPGPFSYSTVHGYWINPTVHGYWNNLRIPHLFRLDCRAKSRSRFAPSKREWMTSDRHSSDFSKTNKIPFTKPTSMWVIFRVSKYKWNRSCFLRISLNAVVVLLRMYHTIIDIMVVLMHLSWSGEACMPYFRCVSWLV